MIIRMRTCYLCTQVIQNVLGNGSVITGTNSSKESLIFLGHRKKMRRQIYEISDITNTSSVKKAVEDAVCIG